MAKAIVVRAAREYLLEIVLVERNRQHDANAEHDADHLQQQLRIGHRPLVRGRQLGHLQRHGRMHMKLYTT